MTRYIRVLVVLALLLLPFKAFAGHYGLEDAGLMDEATVGRLTGMGIPDTAVLWARTASAKEVRALAGKAGVDVKVVSGWHSFCDLLRLDGVGPKIARLMTFAGVRDTAGLARQEPASLLLKLKAERPKVPELGKFPDETNLSAWIGQAKALVKADAAAKRARKK